MTTRHKMVSGFALSSLLLTSSIAFAQSAAAPSKAGGSEQYTAKIKELSRFGDSVRTINTNGTLHPLDTGAPDTDYEFWLGDSRGHWDGDTLVVDVTDFNDQTWLDRAGNFHDESLHVVEHWKYLDANTIDYRATLEDPGIYTRPWTLEVLLYRHREKNFQLIENYCYTLDYDQYYPFPRN